jgi:uncharacterized delta-60 repeat protein
MQALEPRMLFAAGDLDPALGGDGIVALYGSDGNADQNFTMAQPDGKLLVVAGPRPNFAFVTLTRYNMNGKRDLSFGTDGRVVFDPLKVSGSAGGLAIQSNGSILVGVEIANGGYGLMRVTSSGQWDTSFGRNSLAARSTNRIIWITAGFNRIVTARYRSGFEVNRYTMKGLADTTFGTGGTVVTAWKFSWGSKSYNEHAIFQPDGKLIVSGNANEAFALARYNWNGQLDSSFDGDGKKTTYFGGSSQAITRVFVLPDGKILAGGRQLGNPSYTYAFARFLPNGALDKSFNGSGKLVSDVGASRPFALQKDGKLVLAGTTTYAGTGIDDVIIARYNANGSVDKTFGTGGRITMDFYGDDDPRTVFVQPDDGKIVLITRSLRPAKGYLIVSRYLSA